MCRRPAAGRSTFHRLAHLSNYERRERAIGTVVTPLALHGVVSASVRDPDLKGLDSAVVRALWGATRLSRAKDFVFTFFSKECRVSVIMHTRYEEVLWLARVARRPGVTQVFTQAIWESGGRPHGTCPVGRALHTAATLWWSSPDGWWCWDVPEEEHPLHFVHEPLRQIQQWVRSSLRCHSSRQLEARRPVTFKGLGDEVDCPACRTALHAASGESEKSLLHGLMAGALWTVARVSGHGRRTNSACLHCGAAHKDKVHDLWDQPEWEQAKETWRPGSVTRGRPFPNWGRRTSGQPACGRRASSPSGWRRGWLGGSWMSFCTAYTACTWRSWRPAWLRAAGTTRATCTPCSRTFRVRGPATPTPPNPHCRNGGSRGGASTEEI